MCHAVDFRCKDCAIDTNVINEYYMVKDHIWRAARMTTHGGMLCVGCLEGRLGRELHPSDFSGAPINGRSLTQQSERLYSRLKGEKRV